MSPSTMTDLFDHMAKCETPTQAMIFAEIERHGPNKAATPFATTYADGQWWVYIEVDSPGGTFDVETHDPHLIVALNNALSRVRRNFSSRP